MVPEFRNSSLWIAAAWRGWSLGCSTFFVFRSAISSSRAAISIVVFASLQALISAIMPLVNHERIMLEDDMPFLKQVVDDAHQAQARARLWHGGAATPP